MILKKPYAFLIKRFKLIHFILSFLMFYLLYRFYHVLTFFRQYIEKGSSLRVLASDYITLFMFLITLFIILGFIILYLLMRFKKKPNTIYLISIIGYFISFIILWYTLTVLKKLEFVVLDTRIIRLVRDLLLVSLLFQVVISVFMLIRGLGFDIKKFHFDLDIKELNIDVTDSEEFELVVGIDTNKIIRKTRRKSRELKYFILENKFIFTILCILLIMVIVFIIFLNKTVVNKVYKEKEVVPTTLYNILIEDSFYTTMKYDGTRIKNDNKVYVLVKLNIKGRYNDLVLNKNNIRLIIDNKKYYPNLKYCEYFKDIGTCYNKQKINTDESNYLLIYVIDREDVNKNMILTIVDSIKYTSVGIETKYKNIKLMPTSLDIITFGGNSKLGDNLDLKNTVLGDVLFKINAYEIASFFTYDYEVCDNSFCQKKYDKVTSLNNNLSIMSLNIMYTGNDKVFDFIFYYGSLYYVINGEKKKYDLDFVNRTPLKYTGENIYIEVYKEIYDSDNIWFEFNVRDKKYKYILK